MTSKINLNGIIGTSVEVPLIQPVTTKLNISEPHASLLKTLLLKGLNGEDISTEINNVISDQYLVKLISTDVTLNSLIGDLTCGMTPNELRLNTSDITKLTVSYLDWGWCWSVNTLDCTLEVLSGRSESDDSFKVIDNIDHELVTFSLFDYYNKFATDLTKRLESIFGWAQECYLGFECESFFIGFDVSGGSVICEMPIITSSNYKISTNTRDLYDIDYARDRYMIFNQGKGFYGDTQDHFFDTSSRRGCKFTSIDIRLD